MLRSKMKKGVVVLVVVSILVMAGVSGDWVVETYEDSCGNRVEIKSTLQR